MGQPKFPRKQYETPFHPWKEERIKQERELMKKYGLKNHQEIWKAKTFLGKYRHQARELLARMGSRDPQIKREGDQLLFHLTRMGILPLGGSLDDVLALETESVLSRRLQTLVYLKGFSATASQSRQLINHGHVRIGQRKVTIPGYLVAKDEEENIGYTTLSPLTELSHPARPKTDVIRRDIPSPPPTEEKTPVKTKETPPPPIKTESTPPSKPKSEEKPAEQPPQTEPKEQPPSPKEEHKEPKKEDTPPPKPEIKQETPAIAPAPAVEKAQKEKKEDNEKSKKEEPKEKKEA